MTISTLEFFLILYALVNGCAFVAYAYDKKKAAAAAWRTPENLLVLYALAGPFGAYAGMKIFRHKTRKIKFYLVPLFLVIHSAVIACILLNFL
jgi:uncharacterized membrane protein YsdA (DUF1294 family)